MKEFFLELDIYDIISNPLPNFTQFDTGGVFHFTLTEKRRPINLRDCSVEMKLVKADGTPLIHDCVLTSPEVGKVKVELHDQACSMDGVVRGIVDIYDHEGDKTATQQFQFEVVEYLKDNGSIESEPLFPVLQENISKMQTLAGTVSRKVRDYDEFINVYAEENRELKERLKQLEELVELILS